MSEDCEKEQATDTPTVVPKVFISYASPDRTVADAVCGTLESGGLRCWIAPRDVSPGAYYAEAIVRAVDATKVMVLVLSQDAAASPHVLREIERATSKNKTVISLRLDLMPIPPALEYYLNASHWLDSSVSGVTATLPKLVDAVKRLLELGVRLADTPSIRRDNSPSPPTAIPSAAAGANSIAVLPFANMSAGQDQEYFSDGLAEEIINLLAQIPDLKVIARTSAFAFRGKEQDIRGIANALGVTHVLQGSVRRAGNRLRVTGQLIYAADGTHLWSERYDRELRDIFEIQDEISTAIVRALRVKLSNDRARARYMPNIAAYDAYLKAIYLAANVTPESRELARKYFEQASELDAAFALPHIGLGHYWLSVMMFGGCPALEAVPAARAQARRALEIEPSLAEAHALLGVLTAMYDLDWAIAERYFEFPMARLAGFGTFRPMYGWFQFLRGNPVQAVELAQRAIESDPLDVWPRMNLHAYLQAAGRDAEALEQLQKVLELDPHQVAALVSMAMIYADRHDLTQALTIARRAHAIAPWYPDTTAVLAALTHLTGEVAESQSLQRKLGSGDAAGEAHVLAQFHLLRGDLDQGADWTEKAIQERDPAMMVYLRFVVCKELRASHRWPKISKMLNLTE